MAFFVNPQPGSTGNGGELTIETGRLLVADGGFITAATFGTGDAGNINIQAGDIEVTGVFLDLTETFSGIKAGVNEGGTGNGGNLNISGDRLRVTSGGQITALTEGDGNAGNCRS